MESDCPYEVRISERFGRYLVASRDLKARELLIREDPIIEGPTDEPGDSLLCLCCCRKMTENQFSRCSKCRFPVCSVTCEKAEIHASNECEVLSGNRVSFPPPHVKHVLNKSILILRCLLQKKRNPSKWLQLMTMSDSGESRRNRPNCITADERILENFRAFFPKGDDFDIEEVLKVSGILDVNAHAFPVKANGIVVASKCHIYFKTSLIAHSCCPNSSWCPDTLCKSTLVIRTNIEISKGELISVAYDDGDLLYGTLRRLIPMEISGMFICKCVRCIDPTELGTYLSALKCQNCTKGYLLSLNPTDSFSDWACNSCDNIMDEIQISEITDDAETLVGFPKKDILSDIDEPDKVQLLKEYIEEFSGIVLHPNHYILQEVNLRIIRASCGSLDEMDAKGLDDFLRRCKNLLDISNIITPGFCEYRAFLQYQYFRGLLVHQERKSIAWELESDMRNIKKQELVEFLEKYKLIQERQEEVLVFLQEKFSSGNRINFVRETMTFVKDQIKLLENAKMTIMEKQDENEKTLS